MENLKSITKTLNAHLLAYHKDKAEILETLKLQEKLNKHFLSRLEDLDKRVKELEEARKVQIQLNTSLLKEPVKQSWFMNIFNK